MRTETIVKTFKLFHELTASEKAQAIEEHRNFDTNYEWWECIYDDYKTLLTCLGFYNIEMQFSGFSSQGDGACITGKFSPSDDPAKAIKEFYIHAPCFDKEVRGLYLVIDMINDDEIYHRGLYSHSNSIYCDDENVQALARFMSDLLYKSLEETYDDLQTDENVGESLEINEVEFDMDDFKKEGE